MLMRSDNIAIKQKKTYVIIIPEVNNIDRFNNRLIKSIELKTNQSFKMALR